MAAPVLIAGEHLIPLREDLMELQNLSLIERFQQYFDVDLAVTRAQKDAVYALRYRVYCEEFAYEPAEHYFERQEYDEFDRQSLHCVVTHRSSGLPAGCVRLVSTAGTSGDTVLPFEKYCPASVAPEFHQRFGVHRASMCEISRLAVDRNFRRRVGEQASRMGDLESFDCTLQERRTFSLIAVAGFLAATALTDITGRTDVFAMMEPFLPRLLERSGIKFLRAGEDLDYHGTRVACFIKTEWAVESMHDDIRDLYEGIYQQVESSYRARHQGAA